MTTHVDIAIEGEVNDKEVIVYDNGDILITDWLHNTVMLFKGDQIVKIAKAYQATREPSK
jgi:hypothetical protein